MFWHLQICAHAETLRVCFMRDSKQGCVHAQLNTAQLNAEIAVPLNAYGAGSALFLL